MTALMMLMSDEEVARFGRAESFGALRTERGALPLVAMEVDARVAGVIASIELAQAFVNTTGVPIEATYIFPLPDRAAVHRFRMEVAGRVIDGVVEERGAAREQYDHAIASGHRAAITEEERPGVFTLRVGNLMPGETATIRLSLVGPLPIDDGEVTFRFPLVVAPRYIPGAQLGGEQAGLGVALDTNLVPDASRISPPVLLPGCPNPVRLGLRVTLEDRDLHDIASSLHAVTTMKRDALVVEVQPGERLDRDFILRWHVDGSALRTSLVCADDADGRGGTFMMTLVPPSTIPGAVALPRDVVFVIDRSGSMGGWKMVAARRAAARIIDSLTSRDRFCAIAFDNVTDLMPEANLCDATDRNRFRAVEQLAKVDARGGTELAAPLRLATKMLAGGYQDRERVIVLVTDGQVGNEDAILRELVPSLRNVKMFALGIDQAVNAAFLKRLASAGGGLCELVESEDRLDVVMSKVHRRIGTPIVTQLSVHGVGLDIDVASIAPRKLPDVYAGAPITILGRYRNAASPNAGIEIAGTSFGDPMCTTVKRHADSGPASWLAASWARAAIRDREDMYAAGSHGLEHEIVMLSKTYSVLSRFTAFLAVDRSQVVNPGGGLHQVVQAVEEAAGWGNAQSNAPMSKSIMGAVPMASMPPVASRRAAPPPAARPGGARPAPARPAPAPVLSSPLPFGGPPAMPGSAMGGMGGGNAAGMRGAELPTGTRAPTPGYGPPPSNSAPPRSPADAGPPMGGSPKGGAPMAPPSRSRAVEYQGSEDDAMDQLSAQQSQRRETPASSPYLATLAALARELDAQGRGRADATAIRLIRQRLTEWVEDLRSVGDAADLADAVEHLVQRLSAALALATDLANETIVVATELAKLAAGTPPPRKQAGGRAFWK